jgi:hypothetical protein
MFTLAVSELRGNIPYALATLTIGSSVGSEEKALDGVKTHQVPFVVLC